MYAKHLTLINDTLSKKAAKRMICSLFTEGIMEYIPVYKQKKQETLMVLK